MLVPNDEVDKVVDSEMVRQFASASLPPSKDAMFGAGVTSPSRWSQASLSTMQPTLRGEALTGLLHELFKLIT